MEKFGDAAKKKEDLVTCVHSKSYALLSCCFFSMCKYYYNQRVVLLLGWAALQYPSSASLSDTLS